MSRASTKLSKTGAVDEQPTKIPTGIDVSTFFAPHIPEDLKTAFPLFYHYPEELITGLSKLIVKYLASEGSFSLPAKLYSSDVDQHHLNLLMTSIYVIFKQAVRSRAKISAIRTDLTAMKFPSYFVELVCNEMCAARVNLESTALTNRLHFAKLEKLRWRIDVIISSGSLSRIMRPSILMQVVLSDACVPNCSVGNMSTCKLSTDDIKRRQHQDLRSVDRTVQPAALQCGEGTARDPDGGAPPNHQAG
jgi:hypothetical protein